jgi:hypothetical protein
MGDEQKYQVDVPRLNAWPLQDRPMVPSRPRTFHPDFTQMYLVEAQEGT